VTFTQSDTDLTGYDTGPLGSAGLVVAAKAVQYASERLRDLILDLAAKLSSTDRENCRIALDSVDCDGIAIPLTELFIAAEKTGQKLEVVREAYGTPRSVAFNCQGFSITVHRVTGEIMILKSVHAADAGVVVNPLQPRGQVNGAIAQGLGFALSEKMVFDDQGQIVNPSFRESGEAYGLREDEVTDNVANGVVTEVVTTYVKPGQDHEYQTWAEKIHQAEAQFPGYRGGYLQPAASQRQHYWTTLVRFATPEQLDRWLTSDVRKALLRQHDELVQSWEHHRLPSWFSGWFPTDATSSESPKSWKQSMLVILMLFPIVMLEIRFLSPFLTAVSTAPATFIGNVISVILRGWLFMPLAIAPMKWWLLPGRDSPKWKNALGLALLVGLYAVEITVLSWVV
jgi:antibiotic biosynthesis monooxygenase (ABM) superfamily enzyme